MQRDETLKKLEPWDMIPDSEVPEGVNTPNLKARRCVRGDHQIEGVDMIPDSEVPEGVNIPVPEGVNIPDSTWVFKRKQYPDGSVRKLKARWCVRGDHQIEGVDFDTFAPVVAWSTTRLLLILSVVLGLATKQVDYINAFCQADLAEEVYVRMPKLFGKPGHIIRLKEGMYGLKQSHYNFYKTPKEVDDCLFLAKKKV